MLDFARTVDPVAGPPGQFRGIHGPVGILQQFTRGLAVIRIDSGAHRGGEKIFPVLHHHGCPEHMGHALTHRFQLIFGIQFDDGGKLIPR